MSILDTATLSAFERKALDGDGQFAIALALLQINSTVDQLRRDLCFGDDGPHRTPGVFEKIAMELAEAVSILRE